MLTKAVTHTGESCSIGCSIITCQLLWKCTYAEKKHSNCKPVSKQWKKNTHSFYCQDLFVDNGLPISNEDHVFQISHDLHWPLVGFDLFQKLLLVHINT